MMSSLLTDIYQELGGNDHPDEVEKYMVKNVGEGHLLPEMKDCITKVQNLVTQTGGQAWATAFAEVSTLLSLHLPPPRSCIWQWQWQWQQQQHQQSDILGRTTISSEAFEDGSPTIRPTGTGHANCCASCLQLFRARCSCFKDKYVPSN
jgi:hypothetical protein